MTTLRTVVFDTKPYDRESLQRAASNGEIEWHFVDWRLSAETASAAQDARAVYRTTANRFNAPPQMAKLNGISLIGGSPRKPPRPRKMRGQSTVRPRIASTRRLKWRN